MWDFFQDSMLFCDACDKGYHMNCHTPKVTDKPSGKLGSHEPSKAQSFNFIGYDYN